MRRTRSRRGHLLAASALVGATALLGTLSFFMDASASASPSPSTTTTTNPSIPPSSPTTTIPTYPSHYLPPPKNPYNRLNSGMVNSTILLFNKQGQLIMYGDKYVHYVLPQGKGLYKLGESLYNLSCQACHGVAFNGVPGKGTPGGAFPSLLGVGPATIDFWVESGRMPATSTTQTQPIRRPARFNSMQAHAIAYFVSQQSLATPYIPIVQNLPGASLSDGAALFALNCAACHTITGDGDALAYDTFAPSLRDIPATQVAEALRTGPANMPVFTGNLSDKQLRDVVAYVTEKIQHPQNPGGIGLGGLGPVGEGFIGLALGVGLLTLLGFWVGDRT